MIGGVARRRHRFQRPALPFDGVAVLDFDVGAKIAVGAGFRIVLLALEARPRGAMRALGIDRRAGGGLDPRGVRRVVAMGMGDQDMRHGLAAHRIQQRLGMRLVVGTGIDDRDLALAHDVTDRAGEGERARIVAQHPPHAGTRFVDDARLQREVAVERDVVVVGHGDARIFLPSCPGLSHDCPARFLLCKVHGIDLLVCRFATNWTYRGSASAPYEYGLSRHFETSSLV